MFVLRAYLLCVYAVLVEARSYMLLWAAMWVHTHSHTSTIKYEKKKKHSCNSLFYFLEILYPLSSGGAHL